MRRHFPDVTCLSFPPSFPLLQVMCFTSGTRGELNRAPSFSLYRCLFILTKALISPLTIGAVRTLILYFKVVCLMMLTGSRRTEEETREVLHNARLATEAAQRHDTTHCPFYSLCFHVIAQVHLDALAAQWTSTLAGGSGDRDRDRARDASFSCLFSGSSSAAAVAPSDAESLLAADLHIVDIVSRKWEFGLPMLQNLHARIAAKYIEAARMPSHPSLLAIVDATQRQAGLGGPSKSISDVADEVEPIDEEHLAAMHPEDRDRATRIYTCTTVPAVAAAGSTTPSLPVASRSSRGAAAAASFHPPPPSAAVVDSSPQSIVDTINSLDARFGTLMRLTDADLIDMNNLKKELTTGVHGGGAEGDADARQRAAQASNAASHTDMRSMAASRGSPLVAPSARVGLDEMMQFGGFDESDEPLDLQLHQRQAHATTMESPVPSSYVPQRHVTDAMQPVHMPTGAIDESTVAMRGPASVATPSSLQHGSRMLGPHHSLYAHAAHMPSTLPPPSSHDLSFADMSAESLQRREAELREQLQRLVQQQHQPQQQQRHHEPTYYQPHHSYAPSPHLQLHADPHFHHTAPLPHSLSGHQAPYTDASPTMQPHLDVSSFAAHESLSSRRRSSDLAGAQLPVQMPVPVSVPGPPLASSPEEYAAIIAHQQRAMQHQHQQAAERQRQQVAMMHHSHQPSALYHAPYAAHAPGAAYLPYPTGAAAADTTAAHAQRPTHPVGSMAGAYYPLPVHGPHGSSTLGAAFPPPLPPPPPHTH